MLNLGWGEILLIGIVALIAIGPKELPGVLRTVGQALAKVRRMANEFQGQFQEALREADIADLKKHAEDIVSDVSKYDPLTETKNDIEKTFTLPDPMADAGSPTSTADDFNPDDPAPPLPAPTGGVTDGAKLPGAVLPPIDIPLPDMPAPLTEKDFAVAAPAATPDKAPGIQAETPADRPAGGQGVKA
jgi:sec-independent protein translocase protein TatB